MGFVWPFALVALAGIPVLVIAYQRLMARAALEGIAFQTDLSRLEVAGKFGAGWRRHLVPALFGLGALLGVIALARPLAPLPVPDDRAGVVIVLEASFSMYQTDIQPSRLEATKAAIRKLLEKLPEGVRVSLVTYAGNAATVVPLTTNRQRIRDALETVELGSGYSFLPGLDEALTAFPATDFEIPKGARTIVLYSHGHDRSGRNPVDVALEAAKRGITIHAVGVGTHGSNFDEEPLKRVTDHANGRYFPIYSADDLSLASERLSKIVGFKLIPSEVTSLFALAAGLLLFSSLAASALSRRVV
jgi:Ca-activated chloride channel family protein